MTAQSSKDIQVVILGGGQGKRMGSSLPKVLVEMNGRPLLAYVLDAVRASEVDPDPVVVTGYRRERVEEYLGDGVRTVWQEEQKGTGHAVQCCSALLSNACSHVLVLYGDMPFIQPSTIQRLVCVHRSAGEVLTIVTITVPDFGQWRANLAGYGRVLRNRAGQVVDIREVRDATSEILEGREVNPSYFCFQAEWLWTALGRLRSANAQGEFYLTDLARIAVEDGHAIATVEAEPSEGIGVNSPEELVRATAVLCALRGSS